ncbi:EthD family reductase [Dechloromonas sp. HYN0024]|uniref:EthD family reductase n=1 Tax=Dechloromonas sp. HYN0024 TaxID=2231055 RepID=UPI000E444CDB|nr:EthD family reductase [Dechloromonas sp. HYN0024]AXS79101.1 EthD family reductase [Dechloromonas sp. HYN0024]
MIKVTVMYPYVFGSRFDSEYYLCRHVPMVKKLLGDDLKRIDVDFGLVVDGCMQPEFSVMGHLHFESVEAFKASFGPHADMIQGDIQNYTDLIPKLQVSEIRALV